jgi:hypothetical protein
MDISFFLEHLDRYAQIWFRDARDLACDLAPDRRERIASSALQVVLASRPHLICSEEPELTAKVAVQLADALIAELDKNPGGA